jgi:hypothetical protein
VRVVRGFACVRVCTRVCMCEGVYEDLHVWVCHAHTH